MPTTYILLAIIVYRSKLFIRGVNHSKNFVDKKVTVKSKKVTKMSKNIVHLFLSESEWVSDWLVFILYNSVAEYSI